MRLFVYLFPSSYTMLDIRVDRWVNIPFFANMKFISAITFSFLAFSAFLTANVKIEIGSVSTYVPDSDNLTVDATSDNNTYTYLATSPRLELLFLKAADSIFNFNIGAVIHITLDNRIEQLNRLALMPAIESYLLNVFKEYAGTLTDSRPDFVAYDSLYAPTIQEYANGVLSLTKTATVKIASPTLMQFGIYETLIIKVSVKQDANSTYLLMASYVAETAGSADVFFQGFSSSSQVADGDSDGDGFTDFDEIFVFKTDPQKADSNDDGINDFDDRLLRLSPNLYTRVNENASNFGLLSESEVTDLRPSSTLISVQDGNAVLSLGIEESSNLTDWIDTGETVNANLPAPLGTRFFRFKMSE